MLLGLAVGGLAACGDDGGSGGAKAHGGSGRGGSGAVGAGAGSAGGGSGGSGAQGGTSNLQCANEPTADECFGCCDVVHGGALDEINQIFFELCICGVAAPCAEDCVIECMDPGAPLGPACDACTAAVTVPNDPHPCVLDTIEACEMSATCTPILDCWGTC